MTYQRKPITEDQRKQAEASRERVRLARLLYSGVIRVDLTLEEKIEQDRQIKLLNLPF